VPKVIQNTYRIADLDWVDYKKINLISAEAYETLAIFATILYEAITLGPPAIAKRRTGILGTLNFRH
jgi:hypothetical protein